MLNLKRNKKSDIRSDCLLVVVFWYHQLPNCRESRRKDFYMSEFKAPQTQEELDQIIEARLARQKESYESKLSDLENLQNEKSKLESQVAALQSTVEETKSASKTSEQTIADLNKQIDSYKTASLRTTIALKNGLPYDLADRLQGEDEESLTADAQRLAGYIGGKTPPVPPLKNTDDNGTGKNDPYKSLLEGLDLEGE